MTRRDVERDVIVLRGNAAQMRSQADHFGSQLNIHSPFASLVAENLRREAVSFDLEADRLEAALTAEESADGPVDRDDAARESNDRAAGDL